MVPLALMFAVIDYPAFDRQMATAQCKIDIATQDPPDSPFASPAECVASRAADYRHFQLLVKAAPRELAPALRECITDWTKGGLIDWGMVEYCAVGHVDGKRDYDMFRANAVGGERGNIDACVVTWTEGDNQVVNWDMVGSCAAEASAAANPP